MDGAIAPCILLLPSATASGREGHAVYCFSLHSEYTIYCLGYLVHLVLCDVKAKKFLVNEAITGRLL